VGHLDTVTAYDLDDYGFREDDKGEIFGLGTSDMKGGCAAMVEAFTRLAERDIEMPPVGLALVVDEEEDNSGAEALAREYNFPWFIIGEPTNLAPCLGHYAYLEVLLRTRGKRAHSAMPELGRNAIENMLKLLLRISDFVTSRKDGVVYNIRDMTGFPGGFVVPDACEAWLDFHLPPDTMIPSMKKQLRQLMEEAPEQNPDLSVTLTFESTYPGYRIAPEEGLVKKLKEAYHALSLPWKPQDFRSHSDGNVLRKKGTPPVILGPGRLEAAHTPGESVTFSQVLQASQLYLELAASLEGFN
jgi:acetylornithine deacetylase